MIHRATIDGDPYDVKGNGADSVAFSRRRVVALPCSGTASERSVHGADRSRTE
jgi:hypothetical protein